MDIGTTLQMSTYVHSKHTHVRQLVLGTYIPGARIITTATRHHISNTLLHIVLDQADAPKTLDHLGIAECDAGEVDMQERA